MSDALLRDFCKWLAATPLSETIQTTGWIIPALQTIHILAVAVVFSSAMLVNLRIWRLLQRDVPVSDVARRFLPAIWLVLIILLITGGLLIVGEPRRSLLNTTFYFKMAFLTLAVLLTIGLQWSLAAAPENLNNKPGRRIAVQLAAVASTLVWCGVLFAGRWIAYTQVG